MHLEDVKEPKNLKLRMPDKTLSIEKEEPEKVISFLEAKDNYKDKKIKIKTINPFKIDKSKFAQ